MFLLDDNRFGTTYRVFTWQDPRKDGYTGTVIEDVSLDYDMETVHNWPEGHAAPDACLGRSPNDPKHFKVFKYASDLQAAGYQPVMHTFVVFGRWSDYIKVLRNPPNPEQIDELSWYDYVDRVDEAFRQGRGPLQAMIEPRRGDRDEVAAWLARQHLIADSEIQEVWYLPQGAPPNEIRLLELSDRLLADESKVETIDFGVDIAGANFRLVVADVTSDQLERAKQDPARLPPGWSLDGNKIWGRRGA